MICPGCGSEVPNDKRFCTNCGAPLGERTIEMQNVPPAPGTGVPPPPATQPTQVYSRDDVPLEPVYTTPTSRVSPTASQLPPAPPPPGAGPPQSKAPGTGGRRSKGLIIGIVVVSLVLGGAAAGIIIWRISTGNKAIATVSGLELTRADGEKLDLDEVPQDVDLELTATFKARFDEGARATLRLYVVDEGGDEIVGDSYTLESSEDTQTETLEFSITSGTGEPLEARAKLELRGGGEELADQSSLEFAAVEGEGEEEEFDKAMQTAGAQLVAADAAIEQLSALGIEAGDLADQLTELELQLDDATTVEEADAVYDAAAEIIAECDVRAAAADNQDQESSDTEVCLTNMSAIREALDAFYAEEGNFPDSMKDLVDGGYMDALPDCPSGGIYSYQVTDFEGPEFDVTCSVHGSL